MMIRRIAALILAAVLALAVPAFAENETPTVETEVTGFHKYGNVELAIKTPDLLAQGFDYADVIAVTIVGQTLEMPLCNNYTDVDNQQLVCRASQNEEDHGQVSVAIYMGDLATTLGLAEKVTIDEDPGYRWDYKVETPIAVTITLKEKGGYADEYMLHKLERSNDRADYPNLTDAEFANFRAVTTTGMGTGALYRSSSPIDPEMNRNKEADEALEKAGVRTVMNQVDTPQTLVGHDGYALTHYSSRDVIALGMNMDFTSAGFSAKLKEGLLFLIAHEGPWLVHCTEGKDRTGVTCAVLESLMGASAEEIVVDYMVTYHNYYGVEPGTEQYDGIRHGTIEKSLASVIGVDDIYREDLAAAAEKYLLSIGLADSDVAALKAALSKSYGE